MPKEDLWQKTKKIKKQKKLKKKKSYELQIID